MSPESHIINFVVRLAGMKRRTAALVARLPRATGTLDAGRFRGRQAVPSVQAGVPVVTVEPAAGAARRHVLFLHGGAYVLEAAAKHAGFACRLADTLGARISCVDYPLAPEHEPEAVLNAVAAVWDSLRRAWPEDDFAVVGDSAGGGLALSLLQRLRDGGGVMPGRAILVCPWVDLALDDPGLAAQERLDLSLGLPALRRAAELRAGGRDLRDPLVSPLYGRMWGLCPIQLFASTHDLLLSDARRLAKALGAAGTPCACHEERGLIHDWVIVDSPETRQALSAMAAFWA